MIPYIIINGVSSRTINGLIVQSLPPITKPKIRTSIEEIDGRDGDVVTTLGYGAYDKTMTIGLKGDYNIDDVIKFFDTKGKITFSNEIDKYYKFAIYDTINFEKLIRFKSANVNLHCQPFKFSLIEPPKKVTPTGAITSIEIRNSGNVFSKPKLTITGNGIINIYVNDVLILAAVLNSQTMIIDAETLNATDTNGNYMNRSVSGNYEDLKFLPGANNLRITGTATKIIVENFSRWI